MRLLRRLADGACLSRAALSSSLGGEAGTLDRALRELAARGLEVEELPGRGWRLRRPVELLDAAGLRAQLRLAGCDAEVVVLGEVGSTNDWLLEHPAPPGSGPRFCLAEYQRAGRGRRGRRWRAAAARNLILSLGWHFPAAAAPLAGLSLVAGVCAAQALESLGARVGLKWPNDLVAGGAKLGGVLLELSVQSGSATRAVLGLGVNLQQPADVGLGQPQVNLEDLLGAPVERSAVVAAVMVALVRGMRRFEAEGLAPWLDAWRRRDALRGREVRVELPAGRARTGVASGVDGQGRLLLDAGAGLVPVSAGEVTLCRELSHER